MKNPNAVALGRMARGIPKTITEEDRQARRERLAIARKRRHIQVEFRDESFEPTIDSKPAVGEVCSHCRKAECQCSDADTSADIGAKG